jgi:hypothetical protein
MKLVLRILFFLLLGALAIGLYYKNQIEFSLGERIIGFTVLGGAFIYLPLFFIPPLERKTPSRLYHE